MSGVRGRAITVFLFGLVFCAPTVVVGAQEGVTGASIRSLGLEARLDPGLRDARLREIAAHLKGLDAARVHDLQGDFQYALLLQCDPEIYDTLAPETIAAVDNSLEALFNLEDIDQDNRWEPLIYVYGYFNRDVTPETIRDVLARWNKLSDTEKAPRYPTYVHVIDAVCKPVSMGPLADPAATRAALEVVVPALKQMFLQPPMPGTAFHPPSHACLVLGPLYDRWAGDPELGPLVVQHLGSRAEFEAMMASQLPGGPGNSPPGSHVVYGYYAYIGSYLANTLARLDARSAVPALKQSLAIYEANEAKGRVIEYTQRALLALGDPDARAAFETRREDPAQHDACVAAAVWLARNGRGETKAYGLNALGALLACAPADALRVYFEREAEALKG